MTYPFYIVDVFTAARYSGNQLAVVVCEVPLPRKTMQAIALETNYSETAFVLPQPDGNGRYGVRLFTPSRELDFAGHPLLGVGHVIRHHMDGGTDGPIVLALSLSDVPISFNADAEEAETVWFQSPPITSGPDCAPAAMAAALGLAADDLDDRLPVQQMAAGTSAMMVPVRSLAALRRAYLNVQAYAPLLDKGFPPLTYLFTRETIDPKNDLAVRFFFDAHGTREDPATGNGAAFFGAYALNHEVFGQGDVSLRIEQGHVVKRPSLVKLKAARGNDGQQISVGGHVVTTVQGKLV